VKAPKKARVADQSSINRAKRVKGPKEADANASKCKRYSICPSPGEMDGGEAPVEWGGLS